MAEQRPERGLGMVPRRRRCGRARVVVTVVGLLVGWGGAARAQPAAEPTFAQQAARALAHGNRDEAAALAESRAADDPAGVALRARLLIDRGAYADAEALLRPVAEAAPTSAAGFELGRLLQRLGRPNEAEPFLDAAIVAGVRSGEADVLLRGALAARARAEFRQANQLFRAAARAAPDDPAVQTGWGELFLEKYNHPDALASFQAALTLDDEWGTAHLGVAEVLVNENPPQARAAVDRALEIDPGNVDAHLFVARLELDDSNRDAAQTSIAAALEVNPNGLEARALLAAVAYLEDRTDDFDAEVARALAINPRYGDVYRIAGQNVARAYRFPEAVTLVRRALAVDPGNPRAHADLGMHLLRTGDEAGARAALERSFTADPYDIVTYNLLEMMDQLEEFETFERGDLIVRLHPDEAPALKDYVLDLAQEALDELASRYEMTVQAPILIEVFPRHDDFAVRNLGLPGMIGALGACFGNVVTMDSPRARPPGDFNWQATLWHEIAHVVTLQMSKQRLPRWLSEGISTYEEKRKHLAWGRDAVLDFAAALNQGGVLSIRDLNSGFSRPETISLSYFQASVLVEHIIDGHGMEALRTMVRAYGDGLETEDALARIGLDFDGLQASFDAAVEAQFGELRRAVQRPEGELPPGAPGALEDLEVLRERADAQPDNYHVQLALGRAAFDAGETDTARAALERAAELAPMATGFNSPRGLLARLAEADGDAHGTIRELERLLMFDETSIDAVRLYAAMAEDVGDRARRQAAYERLIEIDPFDPVPHQVLGRLALADGRLETARRELTVALALGPIDRVVTHADLAESLLAAGELADAKRQAMAALELAPSYDRALDLLLDIVEAEP